jgi:hypothetical protein
VHASREIWNPLLKLGGGLLLLLGGLKWLSAAFAWGALAQRADPVLGLPENWVMLTTGLIELGGAWLLLWPGSTGSQKGWLMVLLALSWMLYQWLHAEHLTGGGPCPCLGRSTHWFPALARFEREVLTSLTLWFFLVGLAMIVVHDLCMPARDS